MSNSSDYLKLNNKVIIISGGYGHLGSAISKDLMSLNSKVFCFGRDIKKFNKIFYKEKKANKKIYFVKCDVCKENQVRNAVQKVWEKENKIDVLINSALNAEFRADTNNINFVDWKNNLEMTTSGYFLLSKYCIEKMKIRKKGRIINISSLWERLAPITKIHSELKNSPSISLVAGKGANSQFTKYLASTLAKYNILVNSVSPGWFPKKKKIKKKNEKKVKKYIREITSRIPLMRIGKPEEISGIVSFLSSEKSSYITGQNFIVDGGYAIW